MFTYSWSSDQITKKTAKKKKEEKKWQKWWFNLNVNWSTSQLDSYDLNLTSIRALDFIYQYFFPIFVQTTEEKKYFIRDCMPYGIYEYWKTYYAHWHMIPKHSKCNTILFELFLWCVFYTNEKSNEKYK